MSVTQQQVLDALAKVASPRGTTLTNANVLSAISVTDGKVFFSINVDATEARAWESVRARAEAAVRAIPGVNVAMIALNSFTGTAAAMAGFVLGNDVLIIAVTGYGCSAAATATSARARRAAGVVASAAAKPGVADVQAS